MRTRTSRRALVATVAMIGAVLAACSDDGDTTSSKDYSVAGSLGQVPAAASRDSSAMVMSGDLDQASKLAGVDRPAPDADVDDTVTWAQAVTGVSSGGNVSDVSVFPIDALRFERIARVDEIRDELGWSALDVATYAGLDSPPEHFGSMTGTFDESQIDAAQGERTDGVWSLGGDDFDQDLKGITAARPLGNSLRTALHDGRLGQAVSTPTIEAWTDGDETMADDDSLMTVAEALDDEDVYSAIVMRTDGDPDAATPARGTDRTGDTDLAPFDAFGVGADHDDDRAQVVLVYHCDDEDGAERNADALRTLFTEGASIRTQQPWDEMVEVDDVDVDGRVVTVTLDLLDGRSPMIAFQAILVREPFTISP